jgi:hypothetical protein
MLGRADWITLNDGAPTLDLKADQSIKTGGAKYVKRGI